MRLYYIDEAEGSHHHVQTALGVDAERWNDLDRDICAWRVELRERHGFPLGSELHACRGLSRRLGSEVFVGGLRRIEDAARNIGGIEVISTCLRKPDIRDYRRVSLDRLLNRINTSVATANRHAFLIFGQGREQMVTQFYRRLRHRNYVPSSRGVWEDGERTRNVPIVRIIGGPAFRSSGDDRLLQMADLVAHVLLRQEERLSCGVKRLSVVQAFSILDIALNRRAARSDPQGIVRR